MKRYLIAAEWLNDNDRDWWFYSKALELSKGKADIVLVGNARLYDEKDRHSLSGHILYLLKSLYFSVRVCFISKRSDVIFTWNQLPSLIMATLLRVTGNERKIVCQNFLYRSSRSRIIDVFRRRCYNFAIGYKHIYFSLQSEELVHYYNKTCGLSFDVSHTYFVPDCLPDNRIPACIFDKTDEVVREDYIFTGGEANRDWRLVMDIARRLSNYKFCCVARKRFFDFKINIPSNVIMHWDTTLDEYFKLLAGCKISLIPIKDVYNPAGLLLLFDSITLNKRVVSTDTPFLSPFMGEHKRNFCFTGLEEAIDKIERLNNLTWKGPMCESLKRSIGKMNSDTYVAIHLEKFYQLSEVN